MEKIKAFFKTSNWERVGVVAFYGYFAINMLMKAFTYDHGDKIYLFFFLFAIAFWAVKIVTTRYTLREVIWIAILMGLGLTLSVITKQNTWLLLFMTIIAMKNCEFQVLIRLAVYIRVFSLAVLVVGSTFGVFDIGYRTTPDTSYVEIPVYSFGMNEPNTAFLAVFLTLLLLLYYNYEKLNVWWFLGTSAVVVVFYELTYCRTGFAVFFFAWGLIIFEKLVKEKKYKFILALSVAVGVLFSLCTMILYNGSNPLMKLMNHFVSGRIYIMNGYYIDQGLSFIPRAQEVFYASYHGLIDNTYMFVLIYCGLFVALFFFGLVQWTLFRLYRQGHFKELVMIGALALYGVLEQFIMNGFMNPFILLCGILLYPDLLDPKKRPGLLNRKESGKQREQKLCPGLSDLEGCQCRTLEVSENL